MKPARLLAWAVLAQLCVLAVSGVYLLFNYRPTASGARFEFGAGDNTAAVRAAQNVRALHHLDSWLVIGTALALGIVMLVEHRVRTWDTLHSWAIVGVCLVASFTGALLPWDQLALTSVTVGTNLSGYRPLFEHSERFRFVLVSGSEIGVATIRRWLVLHTLIGVVAAAGAAALLLEARRRDRSSD
jgi:quinol-cytochrome oxidoreductase complex cytochrome b subunit